LIFTRASAKSEGSRDAGASSTRIAIPGLILLFLCLIVYNSNLRMLGSYDSLASSLIPFGLWRGDGLLLDRYRGAFPPEVGYSIVRSRTGHLVSLYPPVTPLLASPLYFPALFFREPAQAQISHWRVPFEKFAASLIAALSVLVLYAALRKIAPDLALPLLLAYAFGTSTWVISSQGLWQHGPATLFVSLAILLLVDESPPPWKLALLGFCAALITANRPMDFFFSAAIAWVVARRHGRRSLPFFLPAAVVALVITSYNLVHFGNLLGGYGEYRTPRGEALLRHAPDGGAFLSLLFSNRGILTFSPFLILALAALRSDRSRKDFLRPLLLACLATVVLYASAKGWSGGYTYGPRYLITCLPVLIVALVEPLRRVWRTRGGRIAFALAVGLSVSIQAIGAYCFPGNDSGNESKGAWTIRNSSPVLAATAGLQFPDLVDVIAPGLTIERPLHAAEAAASYEWSVPPPELWPARTRRRLRLWVWNRGTKTLTSFGGLFNRGGVFLDGTWRNDGGHEEAAQPLPGNWLSWRLPAGDAIEATVDLVAPNVTGRMRLSIELDQFGYRPFSNLGSPPLVTEVIIIPGPGYDDFRRACEWQSVDELERLATGSTVEIPIHVRNVSRLPWPRKVRMSYRWRSLDGSTLAVEGLRTDLTEGAETWIGATVPARVRADIPPGEYLLAFDLVDDGAQPRWFEQDGSPPLLARVRVR
jgi:hypothetical protein